MYNLIKKKNVSNMSTVNLHHSYTMEELEIFLTNEINNSQTQFNEDVLNSSSSSFIEPSEVNKYNVLALAMTKTVKENIDLRLDVDALQKLFAEYQVTQGAQIGTMSRTICQLRDEKQELRNGVVDLHIKINERENEMLKMHKIIDTLERDLMDLQQYIRRPSIEISGIPDHIEQRDLQNYVINQILTRTNGCTLNNIDIVACHILK